jgi:hypothetical protein
MCTLPQQPFTNMPAEPDHNHLMESHLSPKECAQETHIGDIPNVILVNIFSTIVNPRVRNCMALTCRDWYWLERQTRTVLSLRGNIYGMQELPMCFKQVTTLDLSHCSPWGYSLFQSTQNGEDIGRWLKTGFPNVADLTVYVRDALDIQMVAWLWPDIESLCLVRWHQRAMENSEAMALGCEIEAILNGCKKLKALNLSKFYCWTEDVPPALQVGAMTAANLRVLNLLKLSPEGFKAQEVGAITAGCPNLEEFYILCEFDHRLLDSVDDDALLAIATNCPRLQVLHLVDFKEWGVVSRNVEEDGYASEDSNLSRQGLEAMFKALPLIEELVFLLSQNIRDVGPSFEVCASVCKKLRSLKLSHFHGVCMGPQLDGIALCTGIQELCLTSCADLTDEALRTISIGCSKLSTLHLQHCKCITEEGLRSCVGNLSHTLIDVGVAFCQLLPTATTLQGLEPILSSVKHLYLDCVWDKGILEQEAAAMARTSTPSSQTPDRSGFSLPTNIAMSSWSEPNFGYCGADGREEMMMTGKRRESSLPPHRLVAKRRRNAAVPENGRDWGLGPISVADASSSASCTALEGSNYHSGHCATDASNTSTVSAGVGSHNGPRTQHLLGKEWKSLEVLSLWLPVGLLISPLPAMGLGSCPMLQELKVKVEGDSRQLLKPNVNWGIKSFVRYPKLQKANLDLSEVTGFSLSAPKGFMDLSLWERHYLTGVSALKLTELDYSPPSDKEVNRRGLSLPAAGLLAECWNLRKLFVHGTTHEHFLMMLARSRSVRDVQLRGDYYPAPELDTELRAISCQRFEAAVAKRGFPD